MKRTRKDLEDFLLQADRTYCVGKGWFTNMADKLISEGWCKVDEPREWVMCPRCWNDPQPWEKWHKLPMMCEICKSNVIHVREVEDSND